MSSAAPSRPRLRTRTLALARQMDWFRGLRCAVALCAPLVLGDLAVIPNMGWAALGGFEAILADSGGPYRSRLATLATLSLGGASGLFLGSLAGGRLVWALPVTVLFCFLWSYLSVLGQPFISAGLLVQVIFICGIGAPTSDWHQALNQALALLAGGAWAALLSLLLWPLDPYRPARAAVSACYRELASFLASIAELAARDQPDPASDPRAPSPPFLPAERMANLDPSSFAPRTRPTPALWHRLARHHQYRVRRAVEHGWRVLAANRATRQADTAQGHLLVVLLEDADLLIARTIALAEHVEAQTTSPCPAGPDSICLDRALASLADLRAADDFVAALLARRGQTAAAAQTIRLAMQRLPASLENCVTQSGPATRFLLALVTEAASLLDTAIESAALLRLGTPPAHKSVPPVPGSVGQFAYVYARLAELRQGWNLTRLLDHLAGNFHRRSLVLRHAARVAMVCGLDVIIVQLIHLNHGYWLLMTSLLVLQPHVSGTMRRSLERVGGTVAGGVLAAVLAVVLPSPLATAAALFPLALLALAILPVSYTVYAFFLTPTFVLAWLPYSGDWQLALFRTVNTLAGALISLLAMAFLFPIYERDRAPQFLRASLAADRLYLAQLAENWRYRAAGRSGSSRLLANARRAAGLAHNDTEESMDRLLAESWPRRRPFARFVAAFVTYLRRFAQSVTTLSALDGEWDWKLSAPVQRRLQLLDRRLLWLEEQISPRPSPTPWPEADSPAEKPPLSPASIPPLDHPGERQLERLERQANVLYRQLKNLREHGWLPDSPQPCPEPADPPSANIAR